MEQKFIGARLENQSKIKRTLRNLTAAVMATGTALCVAPVASHAQSFGSATLLAFVGSTGSVFRSNGLASVTRTGTGVYQVKFNRVLSACYFSIGGVGAGTTVANAQISASDPTILFVRTFVGSTATNAAFNAIVLCGP